MYWLIKDQESTVSTKVIVEATSDAVDNERGRDNTAGVFWQSSMSRPISFTIAMGEMDFHGTELISQDR